MPVIINRVNMKTLFGILLFICSTAFAQGPDPADSTPAKCRWNLKSPLFGETAKIPVLNSYAKELLPPELLDVSYREDASNGSCRPTDDCSNTASSLIYDVYYPLHNYARQKLPAVILFHGGSFRECPGINQTLLKTLCQEFAKRGFVTFNVEYRRGTIRDSRNTSYQSAQDMLAGYRGLQDSKGAIRSIIKRQRLHNINFPQDPYQIDTNQIFIGGVSAGGFLTLIDGWFSDQMIYDIHRSGKDSPLIQDLLGPINADYYFGEPGISYKPLVKGIVSFWGGTPVPVQYLNKQATFFSRESGATPKPIIAFHGARDSTFPYYMNKSQLATFSPPPKSGEFNFNSETSCLPGTSFTLDADTIPDVFMASSLTYYTIAKQLDTAMPVELYLDCQMGHGLDEKDGATFQSDFGTGLDNAQAVTIYMVSRAATFFQAIMNGKTAGAIGPPSKFTECENTRVKCLLPDKPNNCSNYHICSP